MEKRGVFSRIWSTIITSLTFGMSKRYSRDEETNNPWSGNSDPFRTQTHKLRGRGYTKSPIRKRSKRTLGQRKLVFGYQVGRPRLRNKSWGMV